MTETIHDRMVRNADAEGFPAPRFESRLSTFVAGQYVSVSLLGDPKQRYPDFERLHTVDEVWTFALRNVRDNQWRLMGRFVQQDLFVGLRLYRRKELVGKRYSEGAMQTIMDWHDRYSSRDPLRGTTKDDYLSGIVRDVDLD